MTISQIVNNNIIDNQKFDRFFAALTNLEKTAGAKVRLCIVSGTSYSSAKKRLGILKNAFKKVGRADIFQGFAYEYGGLFIDVNGGQHTVANLPLDENSRKQALQIAKKYNLSTNPEYNLYLCFEGEGMSRILFTPSIKNVNKH